MERWLQRTCVWSFSLLMAAAPLGAQEDPEDWPSTIDDSKVVHYVSTDLAFDPPSATWITEGLQILTGGDQVTDPITIGGHDGIKVTGNYLNVKDPSFTEWEDDEFIDILVQVYGDEALLGAGGNQRNFNFLVGTLPELSFPVGGSIPPECKNRKWNWFLFRIPNGQRADGTRFVGSVPAGAQGNTSGGGVNGGTIRFEGVPGFKTRFIAFGELGAFGEPESINICTLAEECPLEPETNLVWVDVNAATSDHLEVLNAGDQTVTFEDNVGPAGDKRRAVRPTGSYMNFGIRDRFLGVPCNDPRAVKLCIEFYDDAALTGASFGPEAFATDDQGGLGSYPPEKRHILEGTGTWMRRSWTVPGVSLAGVNTAPLTGGPRLTFDGGAAVFLSKVHMAVLRTGTHPLAGQDPLADCFDDPKICTEAYGNYAELDLNANIQNGLAPGSSGGDQEMIIEEAGPAGDRRIAVRPAFNDGTPGFTHQYMNLALVGEPLGPSSQPNAHLAICVTYYDDPALLGATFRPEVYQIERSGEVTFGFTSPAIAVSLEGTDAWREAYFEIPEIKFQGVNQGPQAAARFAFSGKVFFTRIRYAVIRPCGPTAGENLLQDCAEVVPPGTRFVRSDTNADAVRDLTDAVIVLNYLFLGGPTPSCLEAADTNDDGARDLTDAVFVLSFLFLGGPAPPAPFPDCGTAEPEADCASFPPCA